MKPKSKDRPDWKVRGDVALRPTTQDRSQERPLDLRRNLWTGQIVPVFIDEDRNDD